MLYRFLPAKLSASYLHGFVSVQHAVSLSPSEAFPKLFPRFRVRPACCIAPSQRSFPQAICTVSCPSSMLYRSLPAKLSASYLHGFMSVQHAVSLPPGEAFRKLFARFHVRPSMLYRFLPVKLSASYFHGFVSVQHALPPSEAFPKLFPRFRVRPACCIAPSQRSSPQAISTVSCPSSMLYRSRPAKLSPSYLHGFMSVQHAVSLHPSEAFRKLYLHGFVSIQHAVSLPPGEAFRKLDSTVSCPSSMLYRSLPVKLSAMLFARFRVRPACCIAPSQRSFPQAICTRSCPSSMLYHSLPVKLSASYFHGFVSVQHAVSLPPSEASRKLFARFRVRPACCTAPSR